MKRFVLLAGVFWVAAAMAADPVCVSCHADLRKLLGQSHPAGKFSMAQCLDCHEQMKKPLGARLHAAHTAGVSCQVCHDLKEGSLYVQGSQRKIGSVDTDTFELYGELMDPGIKGAANLHQKKGVNCQGCHGEPTPQEGATVENEVCESCHGSQKAIAVKTDHYPKGQNPHGSHQGNLPCVKCHQGHSKAQSYCLECHQGFTQKMPEEK